MTAIALLAWIIPLQNNRAAVGLDNGVIELRDVPSGTKISQIKTLKIVKQKAIAFLI